MHGGSSSGSMSFNRTTVVVGRDDQTGCMPKKTGTPVIRE
ncbi:hypothetical protein RISK_001082 [Rhodopirellula islandica]|uniref:Uncharacterized protein n=1 Tax=Rhodopirellula islandica TaxID=595434 RepID=A0A0J1BK21_RHOIS|nr:hypothetical protein RISK_001082 [Rhodopirellula islandica]